MIWIYNEWVTLKQQVNPKNYSRTVQESQEQCQEQQVNAAYKDLPNEMSKRTKPM